jgi:hypothetical protein
MRAVFLSAAIAATGLSACATAPLTLNDDLIVPGERIGEVEIGMPLASLMALKGTPLRTVPIPGTESTSYTFDGFTVGAHDEVYWIIAEDPKFHTAHGVAPGGEQIFARASLGKPKCVVTKDHLTIYDYGNIYFNVDNGSGRVAQLGVQKKTQTCES